MKQILFPFILVLFAQIATANNYIVDALVDDHIVGSSDQWAGKRNFLQESTHAVCESGEVTNIPNGAVVELLSLGKIWKEESNRLLKAHIRYQGKEWYVWARDLKFAPNNPTGTVDSLGSIDFSPNRFRMHTVDAKGEKIITYINQVDVQSPEGHRLYSYFYPTWIIILIAATYLLLILPYFGKKTRAKCIVTLFGVPILLTAMTVLEIFYWFRLGRDTLWFINPDTFSLMPCVLRSIPLVLVLVLQLLSISFYLNYVPAKEGMKISYKFSIYSTLIGLIPCLFVAYFLTDFLVGYDPATTQLSHATLLWLVMGIIFFVLMNIAPAVYYSHAVDTGKRKTNIIIGIATGTFMTIFWLGSIVAIAILIFSLTKLFLAILAQIFFFIAMMFLVKSPLAAGLSGGRGFSSPRIVWRDVHGFRHDTLGAAETANKQIDAAKHQFD